MPNEPERIIVEQIGRSRSSMPYPSLNVIVDEQCYEVYCKNIGTGGIRFICNEEFSAETQIKISLNNGNSIFVDGIILRKKQDEDCFTYSVKFLDYNDKEFVEIGKTEYHILKLAKLIKDVTPELPTFFEKIKTITRRYGILSYHIFLNLIVTVVILVVWRYISTCMNLDDMSKALVFFEKTMCFLMFGLLMIKDLRRFLKDEL